MGIVNNRHSSEGTSDSTNPALFDTTNDSPERSSKSLRISILHHPERMEPNENVETKNVNAFRFHDFTSQPAQSTPSTSTLNNLITTPLPSSQLTEEAHPHHSFNSPNGSVQTEQESGIDGSLVDDVSSPQPQSDQRFGRWTADEKILFLYGLNKFGKGRWKKISLYVPGRYVLSERT
jgi:Myb-like DNA-binding domain